jgi:hypothetical protein
VALYAWIACQLTSAVFWRAGQRETTGNGESDSGINESF